MEIPQSLIDFFKSHSKIALAFSGGVDSAYLLHAASRLGADVGVYYVQTAFQPQFERDDAYRLCQKHNAEIRVLPLDILSDPLVTQNTENRCYHCKKKIFSSILNAAKQDGYGKLMDGSNASDDAGDRPGMRVLKELNVFSPLRTAGLTKETIRSLSRQAGLFTWNKPSYSCLATRIPTSTGITRELLAKIEHAETILMDAGFSGFRVRTAGSSAKIQLQQEQFPRIMQKQEHIIHAFQPYFNEIVLDLVPRPAERGVHE